ncbi:MAG TPA: hypothetical protein VFX16_12705 [Pseudonocardiaceae bacterium]|nr:hypothetical protein [Pseudonocardiaceae bacterium]
MHTIETWERLQTRLFHLGWLGEELPAFVTTPGGAWLFREIAREAQAVAEIVAQYVAEAERAAGKAALTSGSLPAGKSAVTDHGPVDTGTATGRGEAL